MRGSSMFSRAKTISLGNHVGSRRLQSIPASLNREGQLWISIPIIHFRVSLPHYCIECWLIIDHLSLMRNGLGKGTSKWTRWCLETQSWRVPSVFVYRRGVQYQLFLVIRTRRRLSMMFRRSSLMSCLSSPMLVRKFFQSVASHRER